MAPSPAAAPTAAPPPAPRRPPADDADADANDAHTESPLDLPVIDLSSYAAADDNARLALDLRNACETVGFFFLEGHGVPLEVIERAFAAGAAFFALPADAKAACLATPATKNRGWTPPEAETLDPASQTRGDLKEGYYVGREIAPGSPMAALPLHGPNVWPDEKLCPGFRAACEDYHAALLGLAARLLPAVAEAAGVEDVEAFVAAVFGEHGGETGEGGGNGGGNGGGVVPWSQGPMAFARLLQYQPVPSDVDKGIFGCGAHSDWGMLTFLATDGSPGLQVLRRRGAAGGGRRVSGGGAAGAEKTQDDDDGSSPGFSTYWQDVPPRPGAFVVNVGDMLELWTGGRMRSTVHRVVVPPRAAAAAGAAGAAGGGGSGRRSIAFFLDPSYSALIKPAESAFRRPSDAYSPTRAGAYLLARYRETHAGFSEGA